MAKSDLVLVVERGSLHDIRDALGNRSVYTLISFLCLIFVFSVIVIFLIKLNRATMSFTVLTGFQYFTEEFSLLFESVLTFILASSFRLR